MTIPAGWTQESTNLYANNSFYIDQVNYQIKVNSETGNMDLYVQSSFGNTLFARSDSGNNLTFVESGKTKFIESLPPNQRSGLTSQSAISQYLSTKFSLPANTYRANLINGVGNSTFTNMPGINNIPQSASPPKTPISVPSTSSNPITASLDILKDPFSGAKDIDFSSTDEKSLFKNFLLKYPQDLLEKKQDTLVITQFKYTPPNQNFITNLDDIVINGLTRTKYSTDIIGTVILPIPQGISDSNNVGWGPDTMANLQAAAVSSIAKDLPGYAGAAGLGALLGGVTGTGAGSGGKTGLAIKLQTDLINQLGKSQGLKASFGAGLVSTIAGAAGYEVSPESILARGFGIAPNSNLELLFSGPSLRQFTFTYRMSPRGETESKSIRNIIRFFKQGMAARKQANTSGSTASFFLGTPNVFDLKYTYNGRDQIKGLNRFKRCALVGFSVNYAPDGQWASYDGSNPGQPVSVVITLSFNELDPVYNTDYNETANDEVGF